jgi:glycerate dehydrogenase
VKIVFLDSHTMSLDQDMDFTPLEDLGEYLPLEKSDDDDISAGARDADIIITNKIIVDKSVMDVVSGLKFISVIATGYNIVDLEAAGKKGIMVANVPRYASHSVSQHAFALILEIYSNVGKYDRDVKRGDWSKSTSFTLLRYPSFELEGKTIGIIGFGAIGRQTAKIAEGFDMKVLAYDDSDLSGKGYKNSSLDEILSQSDIISIHVPLTPETRDLIAKEEIRKMKRSAVVINTSRGGIVNETHLYQALTTGRIAGAGLDVLSREPPEEGNLLLEELDNLVVTPHTAWSTREARQRLIDSTAENIRAFMDNNPQNIVNRDYLEE